MMQGFGVHTFRMVNERGNSVFVKFHWIPKPARIRSTGTRRSRSRRRSGSSPPRLWEAIEGAYPERELGLQIFTEEQAEKFSFDVLDLTKIVPRSWCR